MNICTSRTAGKEVEQTCCTINIIYMYIYILSFSLVLLISHITSSPLITMLRMMMLNSAYQASLPHPPVLSCLCLSCHAGVLAVFLPALHIDPLYHHSPPPTPHRGKHAGIWMRSGGHWMRRRLTCSERRCEEHSHFGVLYEHRSVRAEHQ